MGKSFTMKACVPLKNNSGIPGTNALKSNYGIPGTNVPFNADTLLLSQTHVLQDPSEGCSVLL